jgi:hypothetical protein
MRNSKLVAVLMTAPLVIGITTLEAAKQHFDVPVTTSLSDYDTTAQSYSLQSDGAGAYKNGVAGVVSVLLTNGYNSIEWGDWRLDLLANPTSREIGISFCDPAHGTTCPLNAVQPDDPGFSATANPPWWGTQWQPARMQTPCSAWTRNMYTMKPGDAFTCSAIILLPKVNNVYYELNMGTIPNPLVPKPETQQLQVTCNSSTTDGNCNSWFLDPIPIVNADGTTSPGRTRTRLQKIVTTNGGNIVSQTNQGDFYLTFHIKVTRP